MMKTIISQLALENIVSRINEKFNTSYKVADVESIRFTSRYINIWTNDGERFDFEYEILQRQCC